MADFDRILASAPINSMAARQLSRGEHWVPSIMVQDHYADMPDLKPAQYYSCTGLKYNAEFTDFRGMEFGRLSVIGVKDKDGSGKASWVCRCKCGSFCTRTAKSLKTAMRGGNSFVGMCGICYYQIRMREGWTPKPKGGLRRG